MRQNTLRACEISFPSDRLPGKNGAIQATISTSSERNEVLASRVELLEHAPLFSVLPLDDLRGIADRFEQLLYGKGDMIFREGEPADSLFLIDQGRVKLFMGIPGHQEMLVAFLDRGQIFGELSVLDRGPRAMNARAMEESTVFRLDAPAFWAILENRPAVARRLLELMARRLRRADQASQDLVFFDATTRLARRLLLLAEDHGETMPDGDAIRIGVRVTQREIAQMIGVNRGSANRLLASFAAQGWIDWNDGLPILKDLEALAKRAF